MHVHTSTRVLRYPLMSQVCAHSPQQHIYAFPQVPAHVNLRQASAHSRPWPRTDELLNLCEFIGEDTQVDGHGLQRIPTLLWSTAASLPFPDGVVIDIAFTCHCRRMLRRTLGTRSDAEERAPEAPEGCTFDGGEYLL